jgi:hypothetical protein
VLRAALIGTACGAVQMLARGLPAGDTERIASRERALRIDRGRVVDRVHVARNGDYFTFLGVPNDVTAFEVHRAADRLRQRFNPARFVDPAFRDVQDALREIQQVIDEAEAVLGDDTLREGYRRNMGTRERRVRA